VWCAYLSSGRKYDAASFRTALGQVAVKKSVWRAAGSAANTFKKEPQSAQMEIIPNQAHQLSVYTYVIFFKACAASFYQRGLLLTAHRLT
jgi:hypothetical protein